jgi:hypothetical protein
MMLASNPVLDDEEQKLLNAAPEKCLRHAIKRGAFSLDQITTDLLPRVAAIVRSIATGERIPEPSTLEILCEIEKAAEPAWEGKGLSVYPSLQSLVDEQTLTLEEAYQAAHAIDRAIGRYLTGTRYAAP